MQRRLSEKYSNDKFDIVIDTYGIQELYEHCPGFLKEGGSFITVGIAFAEYSYGSLLVAVSRMMKNILWPRILGGTPRRYVQVASVANLEGLQKLKGMCEDGKLKVPVDSLWDFPDVFKV